MDRRYKVVVCDSMPEAVDIAASGRISVLGNPIVVGDKVVVRFVGRHTPTWGYKVAVLDTDGQTIIYG